MGRRGLRLRKRSASGCVTLPSRVSFFQLIEGHRTRGCRPCQTSEEASCAAQLHLDDFDEGWLIGQNLSDGARCDAALPKRLNGAVR
jgi:hypothetical protein